MGLAFHPFRQAVEITGETMPRPLPRARRTARPRIDPVRRREDLHRQHRGLDEDIRDIHAGWDFHLLFCDSAFYGARPVKALAAQARDDARTGVGVARGRSPGAAPLRGLRPARSIGGRLLHPPRHEGGDGPHGRPAPHGRVQLDVDHARGAAQRLGPCSRIRSEPPTRSSSTAYPAWPTRGPGPTRTPTFSARAGRIGTRRGRCRPRCSSRRADEPFSSRRAPSTTTTRTSSSCRL